MYLILNTSGPK